ncbi:uncharacterized protein [Venturia canescens]|uniref:uncharacterized protein n=1 Tax=Venturia canescens TaxID=32260 RepID=UPI001C9BDA58|nr:uncharacterized protein LOC122408394 [Venturia canescens]
MGMNIISCLLVAYASILVLAQSNPRQEKHRTSVGNLEPESLEPENHGVSRRLVTIQRVDEELIEAQNRQDDVEIFSGNDEKILAFGKRLLESVTHYGVLEDQANLIESGQYRIDWWKKNRRLEKTRQRLYEELARAPRLYEHLNRLGWRTTLQNSIVKKEKNSHRPEIRQSFVEASSIEANSFLKKIMKINFPELLNVGTTLSEQETKDRQPIIFVYVKIMLARPSEIDGIDDASVSDVPESPVKFTLDPDEPRDFGASDVDVVDIESQSLPISNSIDESLSRLDSGEESLDPDRILQLIPLVVDELRNGRLNGEERRSLSWIFGKRLWQLLERDSRKSPKEMMDRDLVLFLMKGELPARTVTRSGRRRRRSPLDGFKKRTILETVA